MALYKVNGDSNEEVGNNERQKHKTINPDYIYLHNCSNYHQMLNNPDNKYLQNIRASDKTLRGNCNSRVAMSEEKRDHGNIYMWVMEHGIENIKCMCLLESKG